MPGPVGAISPVRWDIGGDGKPQFGGWTWRYDLVAAEPSRTEVTLTYDWTAVPPFLREHITFPPFPVDHLTNSLRHLWGSKGRPELLTCGDPPLPCHRA